MSHKAQVCWHTGRQSKSEALSECQALQTEDAVSKSCRPSPWNICKAVTGSSSQPFASLCWKQVQSIFEPRLGDLAMTYTWIALKSSISQSGSLEPPESQHEAPGKKCSYHEPFVHSEVADLRGIPHHVIEVCHSLSPLNSAPG